MTTWNESGYDAADPKSPDFFDRYAEQADLRKKRERECPEPVRQKQRDPEEDKGVE